VQCPVARRVDLVGVEAPPPVQAPLAKKKKQGAKALRRTSVQQAPRSASIRGCGRGSVKAIADSFIRCGGGGLR
jgi:hypothetical protein